MSNPFGTSSGGTSSGGGCLGALGMGFFLFFVFMPFAALASVQIAKASGQTWLEFRQDVINKNCRSHQ